MKVQLCIVDDKNGTFIKGDDGKWVCVETVYEVGDDLAGQLDKKCSEMEGNNKHDSHYKDQ